MDRGWILARIEREHPEVRGRWVVRGGLDARERWALRYGGHLCSVLGDRWQIINAIDPVQPLWPIGTQLRIGSSPHVWRVDVVVPRRTGQVGHGIHVSAWNGKRRMQRMLSPEQQARIEVVR
jgi:hypothetical protein